MNDFNSFILKWSKVSVSTNVIANTLSNLTTVENNELNSNKEILKI